MSQIVLLTQADCRLCDHAKHVLARVARDVPLSVTEIDLGSDVGRRLAAEAGVMFAPGILLNGEAFSYGRLLERKLRKTLAIQTTTLHQPFQKLRTSTMRQLLAYLPLLACPVGMGLMMWMMMRPGGRQQPAPSPSQPEPFAPSVPDTAAMTPAQHAELAQLRAELDELRVDDRTRQRH